MSTSTSNGRVSRVIDEILNRIARSLIDINYHIEIQKTRVPLRATGTIGAW